MSPPRWTLVIPTAPHAVRRPATIAPGARAVRLGFLSNRKINTNTLQRVVAERAARRHPHLLMSFYEKENSASAADPGLLRKIALESDIVLNGTGD